MKINKALLFKIMLSGIIILPAFVGATAQRNHSKTNEQQEMLKMIEQLDQLDKMDFEDAIYKAKTCIINRDFQCTEKQFMKAKKYAHGSGDQRILLSARQGLIAEQKLVKEEKVEEKRRYRAEQRRRREARERRKEEKERKKERRKAEKRRQQEREYARRQSEDEQSRQQMYATFMNGLDDIENMSRDINSQYNADLQRNLDNIERKKDERKRQQRYENERIERQQRADAEARRRRENEKRRAEERQARLERLQRTDTKARRARERESRVQERQTEEGVALTWKNKAGYWFACGPIQCIQAGEKTEEGALDFVLSDRRHSAEHRGWNGRCNRYVVSGVESFDYSPAKVERLSKCN